MNGLNELNASWLSSPTNTALRKAMHDRVLQSAKDLIRKGYIPPQYQDQMLQNIDGAVREMLQSPFKECSCTNCHFTYYGPKKWLHFHNGWCMKLDSKEQLGGQVSAQDYKLY